MVMQDNAAVVTDLDRKGGGDILGRGMREDAGYRDVDASKQKKVTIEFVSKLGGREGGEGRGAGRCESR